MEERELPVGWEQVAIGELNTYTSLSVNPQEAPENTFELYSVPSFASRSPELVLGSEIGSTKQIVEEGDVLICKINPRINRVWSVGGKGAYPQIASSEWMVLRSPGLDSGFLRHLFSAPFFREILCDGVTGVGGSLTRAQPKRVREFEIPLAPLHEQRRIAAKLDFTLAAVDSCRHRLEGVAALIKRFRQAVLEAAITGSLSEEWRGTNGFQWAPKRLTIGEVGGIVTGNTPPQLNADTDGRFPLFKPTELDAGYEVISAKEMMGEKRAKGSRMLPPLSVLVTCIGATIGKTGLSRVEGATNQQINALVCNRTIALPQWAYFWFASPIGQAAVVNNASATTLPIINKSRFSALEIKVPHIDEQEVIVRQVEALFSLADQLEAKLNAARQVVERLTPALLAKAFRGELVPQDPFDEPASVLLERIRAARQAESGAGKPSRRGRRSAAATPAPGVADAAPAPPDLLATLLRECGALSHKALLAASELEPDRFEAQRELERQAGRIRRIWEDGEALWEAVG